MTIWFDVEDLVRYFHYAPRPTGIQRLSFELYRELSRAGEIKFCRRGAGTSGFRSLNFPDLEAAILAAAAAAPAADNLKATAPRSPTAAEIFVRSLSPRYRQPLGEIFRGLSQMCFGLARLAKGVAAQRTRKTAQDVQIGGQQFGLSGAEVTFAPGDWFVNLGASWDLAYDPAFLKTLNHGGVRFAVLVYDLIPELFPEWTIPSSAGAHRDWLLQTVTAANAVFAISRCTANDLSHWLQAQGKTAPPTVVLPIGSISPQTTATLPSPVETPFILLVSTLEIRKNHQLMFRVWRRLLQNLPAAQVPTLVFAGKPGWLTTDLLQQFTNSNWLDGKIKFLSGPSEPELAALYKNCLFTVFPSFYEGWGLPITESLSHGKTVAASNRAAIPEAGGDFCAYFDPDNLDDAYNIIAGLIQNPERVAARQSRIAAKFVSPNWADTATAVLRVLHPKFIESGGNPCFMAAAQSPR